MRQRYGSPLPLAARRWLERLANVIWFSEDGLKHGLTWQGLDLVRGHSLDRSLTSAEFWTITELVRDYDLPCRLLTGDIGYGLCVALYDHARDVFVPPTPLFAFSDRHLPSARGGWPNADHAWKTLETFTHHPDNLDILEIYRIPPPSERKDYEWR